MLFPTSLTLTCIRNSTFRLYFKPVGSDGLPYDLTDKELSASVSNLKRLERYADFDLELLSLPGYWFSMTLTPQQTESLPTVAAFDLQVKLTERQFFYVKGIFVSQDTALSRKPPIGYDLLVADQKLVALDLKHYKDDQAAALGGLRLDGAYIDAHTLELRTVSTSPINLNSHLSNKFNYLPYI